ncbi:AI-2E family transporter [Weissella halotolerans]|uniref:Permease n=1 Tax=Weissella halotolerans DSM 20190 TaxID=1123500 RepID=A0A0R2FWZ8_9LACO|nr:AI-2E family transporter [Weissella halotolerans]KRN32187.1 permease [Weissella halotolerans DSM 20190]
MQQLKGSRIFFWTIELLAAAALVWVLSQLAFIMNPIGQFIGAVFVPLLVSGFLYYLMNPLVELLQKIHMGNRYLPRGVGIAIVMIFFVSIIAVGLLTLLPNLANQLAKIMASTPQFVQDAQEWLRQLSRSRWVQEYGSQIDFNKLQQQIEKYGGSMVMNTATGFGSVVGTLTSVTMSAITIPIMTIYMLSDGNKLSPFLQRLFSDKNQDNIAGLLSSLNKTLSQYISGQAIEMIFVGVCTTIGYTLIGQNYALLLGFVAGLTNLIPYVGPYIGYIPAVFVAFTQSPLQALWVTIVVLIVQQIDGNILYPKIIGSTLNIHPLTILVILLAAGNIAGIAGMILAVPFYAVVRTIVIYAYQIWQVERQAHKQKSIME